MSTAENPREYTTCVQCGYRRVLPERCKCKRQVP